MVLQHLYIGLEKDADGYPPFETEEIDATSLGGGRFRVNSVPVFAYGLSKDDIVRAVRVRGDERLWVAEVLETGGHWTARVIPMDNHPGDSVASEFLAVRVAAHMTPFGVIAIDVPPSVLAGPVLDLLRSGRDAGHWDFDLGVAPEH